LAGESGEDPGCHLVDDGSSQLIAVEEADSNGEKPQALWVRVGMVYDFGELRGEPGIWVKYQEHHMAGPLAGPVLLTPAVWEQLVAAVDELLSRRGVNTSVGKLMKAVRAVHAKYKARSAEVTSLRAEVNRLEDGLRQCQAAFHSQTELVALAEDVLRRKRVLLWRWCLQRGSTVV
jgi:hypothetical protein